MSIVHEVVTDDFSLEVNSEDTEILAGKENDQTENETPGRNNEPTENLSSQDLAVSVVVDEDTIDMIEESVDTNTEGTAGTVQLPGFKGIIELKLIEELASSSVEDTGKDTDNEGFPWEISVHTSTIGNHTSQEGIGSGGGVFSEFSFFMEAINEVMLEDEDEKSSTATTEEGVSSALFSGSPVNSGLHEDTATSVEENELEPKDQSSEKSVAEVGGTEFFIFVFNDSLSEGGEFFSRLDNNRSVSIMGRDFLLLLLEDILEIVILVVSRANHEETSQTSISTSTVDHTRASEISVVEAFIEPALTPSPGDDEWVDKDLHNEGVDGSGLEGGTFRDTASSNGNYDAGNGDLEKPVTPLGDDVFMGIVPFVTSPEFVASDESTVGITESNCVTKEPPAEGGNEDVDDELVPNNVSVLFTNTAGFEESETALHTEDDTTTDDDPSLVKRLTENFNLSRRH